MKMLYVIRHAKSSWNELGARDFDRKLNERGRKDAPEMAERLKRKGVIPNLIISSTAERAKSTALIFAQVLGYDTDTILWKDTLYEADIDTIYDVVRKIGEPYDTVLMFGHNPTWTYFVNGLADVRIDNIPTCGIAEISVSGAWKDVKEGAAALVSFDFPKNL
jgi:phosphohistidine phosphatase